MLGLLRHDEPKSHRLCFAKKAVAFFNISRSSCRMRFSLRSRASSSRSAVVNAPDLPLPRSTRVCSTHLRNDDSVKSRSRAAAPTVFPSSSTSRTAPALNSSLKLRRVRLGCLSAIVDIVSAFRKVSTKPDQAQATLIGEYMAVARQQRPPFFVQAEGDDGIARLFLHMRHD